MKDGVLIFDHPAKSEQQFRERDISAICDRNLGQELSDCLVESLEGRFLDEDVGDSAVTALDEFSIVDLKTALIMVKPQTLNYIVSQVCPGCYDCINEAAFDQIYEQKSKAGRHHWT